METTGKDASSIALRAIAMLEKIAEAERPLTLAQLTVRLALPKPTVLRIAGLLEANGLLQRDVDGARYVIGPRLNHIALEAMQHSTQWGARRAILGALVQEVGETCNLTVLNGEAAVYLDRVESSWPLQAQLGPGSRVPLHCTASGKLFLAGMPRDRRAALLRSPLHACTEHTLTDPHALEAQLAEIGKSGVSTDREEFMRGMVAVAVPVLDAKGRTCAAVAVHGPLGRFDIERALGCVPALRRAAQALGESML